MSYVKSYDVGQINIDLLHTIAIDDPPFVQYTHELPLLSFSDVQHNMNLSLVFNYERYRDEKANNKNPFFIAPGFKLNLHKRLTTNQLSAPILFQGEDGRNINIMSFGSTFTFDDESQRIIRRTAHTQKPIGGNTLPEDDLTTYTYTVEHSDFSKEDYNEAGRITNAYDKYGNVVLSYAYNTSGRLEYVTFRGSKKVEFGYSASNRLNSIKYDGKTTTFVYTGGMLNYVQHYTGVKYTFTLSQPPFSSFEVNYECKASATENSTTVSYSKKLELDTNNQGKKINVFDTIGSTVVNTVSYLYPRSFMLDSPPFKYVDIIDNNGVLTRVQIDNNKVLCAYELPSGEPQFEVKTTDAYSRYLGNVTLYNGTVASLNNHDSGTQTINDGLLMNYYTYDNSHCWGSDIVSTNERKGYYTISGWIKSNVDYVYSEVVYIGNTLATNNSYEIFIEPNKKWQYFSITVYIEANTVYLRTAETIQNVSLRDVRLTFQRPDDLTKGNLKNTAMSDYVLFNDNDVIAINGTKFYYSVNSANYEIKGVDGDPKIVTFSDIMRYKLRKKRDGVSNEVYYNNCKGIITGATDLKVLVDEENNEYISISNFELGVRVCAKGRRSLTKISLNESSQSSNVVQTCTVTTNTEESVVSTETLNTNLDVISSTVDNVTTQYVRNSQGLVTRESVSGIYRYDTTYTDTLITVKEVNPSTSATMSTTKYHIDSTWGSVYKVEMPDGSVINDTYDDDKSVLTSKAFDNASTRQHGFDYSKGRLSSMTSGAINYGFGYATNTGDISSITKNGATVENHTYSRSNGKTTVNSKYPSSSSALYTETKVIDKYGRLESINGILNVSYDIDPYWYYFDSNNKKHTTMESYNRATHGELNQITKGVNGNGAMMSQTTDSLASEVARYGYDNGNLTAVVTRDMANNLRRQETFVYDNANRVTRNRFDHSMVPNEYVTSDIGYVKAASDPKADSRVSNYSFKINGTQKAKTVNTYDTYKRVTKKTYTVGSKTFTKEIVYDKTKVNKVIDSVGGTTQYEYDSMGRISKEKDSSGNILRSYTYDSYGQLIRENNKALDKTFVFEYNNTGGITKVKEYAYTTSSTPTGTATEKTNTYDSTYPDRLTKCGSTSISYNSMGCPTTCNGYTATWTRGKLSKLSKGLKAVGTHAYNYTYNAFGQRIGINYVYTAGTSSSSAVVMGMLTGYSHTFRYDQSGRLICESKTSQYYGEGSSNEQIVYLYDETGIIGMVHTTESGTTTAYYFQRNLLGDVIGIYTTGGTKVGGYTYDAWGNCTITLNTNGIAARNPIRYRGYYYDQDTKLYFLNARYYNPEWRRFISPASIGELNPTIVNGFNLYNYANNNPVSIVYGAFCGGGIESIGMVGSITKSMVKNHSPKQSSISIKLPEQNWVSLGIDFSASMAGALNILNWTAKNPEFYDFLYTAYGLSKYEVLSNLKSPITKIASVVSYTLVAYETISEVVGHINAGDSWQTTAASGVVTAGVGVLNTWASAKIGAVVGTAIGGGPGFIIGTAAGIVAGVIINGVFYTEINGKSISGYIEDGIEWLLELMP